MPRQYLDFMKDERVYSVKELTELTGIGIVTVYDGIREGYIKVVRVPTGLFKHRNMIPQREIDRMKAEGRIKETKP